MNIASDLLKSLAEAVANAQGHGGGIVHEPLDPRAVRIKAKLTQVQMAPLLGMVVSRSWWKFEGGVISG